jgi:hypothetical protein
MLRPYGIKSTTVRTGDETAKGYRRADLVDVWRRYVHEPSVPPSQGSQGSQPAIPAGQARDGNVTATDSESVTWSDQRKHADVTLVTDVTEEPSVRVTNSTCRRCGRPHDGPSLCPTCLADLHARAKETA